MKTAKELCEEIKGLEEKNFEKSISVCIEKIQGELLKNSGIVFIYTDSYNWEITTQLVYNKALKDAVRARLTELGYSMEDISKEEEQSYVKYTKKGFWLFTYTDYSVDVRNIIVPGFKYSANCDCKEGE